MENGTLVSCILVTDSDVMEIEGNEVVVSEDENDDDDDPKDSDWRVELEGVE